MKVPTRFGAAVLVIAVWLATGLHAAFAQAEPAYVVGIGASDPSHAYVPMFHQYLEASFFLAPADLVNLAVPGATTLDINLEQLAPAIAAIQAHHPVVVSWGGGGNNLLDFIQSPQAAACRQSQSCLARINALLNNAEQNINVTLRTLRFFAGTQPLLVRTQYNSLRRTGCATPDRVALADAALEGVPGTLLSSGLNDRIRALAATYGATVADLFPLFLGPAADDLISADCVHPNDLGHAAIRDAFIQAFENP